MKKTILLFFATLALLGSVRAQNDSTYIWHLGEYPYYYYCHDWPAAFLGDNVICTLWYRVNADDVDEAATSLGAYSVREYAELFHTDDSLDVIGIAIGPVWLASEETVVITLYDSSMNELAVMDVPADRVGTTQYDEQEVVIRLISGLNSYISDRYGSMIFFYELPIKDEIGKIIGDFYIGMRVGNLYKLPTCLFEIDENTVFWPPYMPHDPPYHYDGHQYRLKVGNVWDTLRTSHFMPLLFPIYNPWCKAPNMVTASPLMDGCVDVWWNTDGIPASWEISLVGNDTTEIYTSSTTSAHICGLYPTETYTLRIRSLCEADDQGQMWSAWSIPIQINHTSVGISYMEEEPVCSIMPNPAHGSATVQCDDGIRSVELLTVKGERILYQDMAGKQACTIDLTGLAKGIYIVQITTPQGTAARKLAVE